LNSGEIKLSDIDLEILVEFYSDYRYAVNQVQLSNVFLAVAWPNSWRRVSLRSCISTSSHTCKMRSTF